MDVLRSPLDVSGILAILTTSGFFGILALLLVAQAKPPDSQLVNVLVGGLSTAWAMIVSYYFGSSAGSKKKTDLLAKVGSAEP